MNATGKECVIGHSVCVLQFISLVSHISAGLVLVLEMEIQVGRGLVLFQNRHRHNNVVIIISRISGFGWNKTDEYLTW